MKYQIILFTSIILGLSGCHQSAATTDTPTPPIQAASLPAEPVSQRNLLEDREALALAKSRLQALPSFAEKPVQVLYKIRISPMKFGLCAISMANGASRLWKTCQTIRQPHKFHVISRR